MSILLAFKDFYEQMWGAKAFGPVNHPSYHAHATVAFALAFVVFLLLEAAVRKIVMKKDLQRRAASARKRRRCKVHASCLAYAFKDCKSDINRFSEQTVDGLRKGVLSNSIDPRDVVASCSLRCIELVSFRNDGDKKGVNCIAEELYEDAFEQAAAEVEQAKEKKTDVKVVLKGCPISVKDCIGVRGALSTGGMSCRADKVSMRDSALVSTLRSQGALILCRGNVPQSLMLPETTNNIWGRTRNPWNLDRTPGGSSGGEAALVATGCVVLGIGSDVGGSIRIPAAFCGVVGFKPSPGRISSRGCMSARLKDRHGMENIIPSTAGPLARTVEDCAAFCEAVWSQQHYQLDGTLPPIPYDKAAFTNRKKLKIGYFYTDGWFEPCRAAKRGLTETVAALRKEGHDLVEIPFPGDGKAIYQTYVALAAGEGNMKSFELGLEGEPLVKEYMQLKRAASLPNFLRPLVSFFLDERRSSLLAATRSGGISVYEFLQHLADVKIIRRKWAEAVEGANLDGIIHPALPLPALKHGTSGDITAAFSYTLLANLLLWPAGVVPVTTVQKDEQIYSFSEDIPINQRDHWAKNAQIQMQNSAGLPLAVAVMTTPFRDERCLNIMKEVERVAAFKARPTAYLDPTAQNDK